MATDLRDPLGRALDELRSDVADVPLAAAADVRARGDHRTRRTRTALGAGAVVAVAAIAVGASVLPGSLGAGDRSPVPPAGGTVTASATGSATVPTTPSVTGSAPTTPPATARRSVIDVTPVGVGHVPAAYFLPGTLWTGRDFVHGQRIESIEPKEFEGSVQRFTCDPDTSLTGDVAFVQAAREDGTIAGTQKVRLLASVDKAAQHAASVAAELPGCQQRLREQAAKEAKNLPSGETAPTPTAEVTEDTAARADDATGSVRLYKTVSDYGTGAGSRLIEWVAVVREGDAVSLLSLNQFEQGDVSFTALDRIAREARVQLAWAAQRS
jgi:hypothetical protein